MGLYQRKATEPIEAIRFTGDNVDEVWRTFGAAGIYGPTECNPDCLLLTTISGDQVPCRVGSWVIRERENAERFYPCDPVVFAQSYEKCGP